MDADGTNDPKYIKFFIEELKKVLIAKKYSFLGQYEPTIKGSIKKFGWFATKMTGPDFGAICLFCIEILLKNSFIANTEILCISE